MNDPTREVEGNDQAASAPPAGELVGPWRILTRLGSGGMGDVFLAERADGHYQQTVALKRMRGQVSPQTRARFVVERQALSRLEHPNIARLIDGGEDAHGQPYLVMEYVEGLGVDQTLVHAPIDQVLSLFAQLCDAVAYAHRRLVLHRDIKPSNVLVTRDRQLKLLDFGIAKLLQDNDPDDQTLHGQRAYTPAYSSPEQISGQTVGVASDVYSLGILLFQLLTGMAPKRGDSSSDPNAGRATAPSIAALENFSLEPAQRRQLSHALRGELDAIVLKATHPDPEQRYASVEALAEDLRRRNRFLPLQARAPTLPYRSRLFLRRNRVALVTAALISLSLLAGVVASLQQARIAEQQRLRAEERFEDVRSLARSMLFELHDAIARLPGSTAARSLLVQKARSYLSRLDEGGDAPLGIKRELAEAWLRVGDVQGLPTQSNLGETEAALESYAEAERAVNTVLDATPDDMQALLLQARIVLNRASTEFSTDQLEIADRSFRRAEALWRELDRRGANGAALGLMNALVGMGDNAFWSDQRPQALSAFDAALRVLPRVTGLDDRERTLREASIQTRRADAMAWEGDPDSARHLLGEVLTSLAHLRAREPDDAQVLDATALAWIKIGESHEEGSDPVQSVHAYQEASTLFAHLASIDQANLRARRMHALATRKLGFALSGLGQHDAARTSLDASLTNMRELARDDPANQEHRRDIANTLYRIAEVELAQGNAGDALRAAVEIVELRRGILRSSPRSTIFRRDLAMGLDLLAGLDTDQHRRCAFRKESNELWQGLLAENAVFPTDEPLMQASASAHTECTAKAD